MIEEKKKVVFPTPDFLSFQLEGNSETISVKRYLSSSEQTVLAGIYMQELTKNDPAFLSYNILDAENALMVSVIQYCTNIMTVSEDSEGKQVALFTIDDIFSNFYIWERIQSGIVNYLDFRKRLDMIVEEYKEKKRLEASLGNALKTVSANIIDLITKLSETEFSPEAIERVKGLLKEVESSPILKGSLDLFRERSEKAD